MLSIQAALSPLTWLQRPAQVPGLREVSESSASFCVVLGVQKRNWGFFRETFRWQAALEKAVSAEGT